MVNYLAGPGQEVKCPAHRHVVNPRVQQTGNQSQLLNGESLADFARVTNDDPRAEHQAVTRHYPKQVQTPHA